MGKGGKSSNSAGFTQKHLHSRISYLYQAATYLGAARQRANQHAFKTRDIKKTTPDQADGQKPDAQWTTAEAIANRPRSTHADTSKSNTMLLESQLQSQKEPVFPDMPSSQAHHLLTSMRSISQKSQIRLSRSIKRSVCRRCNVLLGLNSTAEIENQSRGGRKPWADVLVVSCSRCGYVKRYAIGMGEEGEPKNKKKVGHVAAVKKGSVNCGKSAGRT
jgi:ribonuclease P protein subunit RPR2